MRIFWLAIFVLSNVALALPPEYEKLTAFEKQAYWVERTVANRYASLPPYSPPRSCAERVIGVAKMVRELGRLSLSGIRYSDEKIPGSLKIVHAFGATAPATVEFFNNPYSGILSGKFLPVFVRISTAATPKPYIFGTAIKFFIDGRESVDLHLVNNVDGQGENPNPFRQSLSNIIPNPKNFPGRAAGFFFSFISGAPGRLSLRHMGRITGEGTTVRNGKTPYQIVFTPVANGAERFLNGNEDYREQLGKLSLGTELWQILARETKDSPLKLIGRVNLNAPFVASEAGDRELFFRHEFLSIRNRENHRRMMQRQP